MSDETCVHRPAPGACPTRRTAPGWHRRQWLQALPALWPGLAATGLLPSLASAADDPAWSALDWLQGEPVAPGQGVPMVLVFWATWCAYCRRHNVHVDRLHTRVKGRLHVVGIAVESDAAAVRAYLRSTGFRFPVALDNGALRRRHTERRMVPMTCTLDRDGRAGLCIPGEMSEDDVLGLAKLARPVGG